MKRLTLSRLSCLVILVFFAIFLFQGCANHESFGEDLEVQVLPSTISYPEILNAREFIEIVSAAPFMNTNGHPVTFELVSIKKGEEMLDTSYLSHVSILNYSVVESEVSNAQDGSWIIYTNDLFEIGKITIAEGNPFANGEYFFTVSASAEVNGVMESKVYEDALRLVIGPDLIDGVAYCPFNMNLVSGENTTSNPIDIFGGNADVRFELGTESDKLSIDAATGVISLNSSYTISATEVLKPIINVISNVSEEVMSFEEQFTATLSTTPVVLDKETNYFYFPSLAPTVRTAVFQGGPNYTHQVIDYHTLPTDNWFNRIAHWRAQRGQNWIPDVETPDAVAVRADAGVNNKRTLEHPFWTINAPTDSWITTNPVNLSLYEGCFTSKVVFWYKLNLASCYELDGSTPIGLEAHITTNYTGDARTTDWTQVNDILECEINDNGTIITGTPYPGDPAANNLWVRAELDLEDYKTETSFAISFRLKTYFETAPNCDVQGGLLISNVHYVATEK